MRESTEDRWETETHLISCRQTGSAVNHIWCGRQAGSCSAKRNGYFWTLTTFLYFFNTLTGTTANRLAPKKNKKMTLDEKTCVRQLRHLNVIQVFRPGIICVMHNEISWRPELQTNTFRMPGFRTRTNKAKSKCANAEKQPSRAVKAVRERGGLG